MNTKKTCFPRKIGSMSGKVSLLTILAVALLLSPMVAYGATVTLAWDANTETDLDGYKIYYGKVSRTVSSNYSNSIDVGNTTQYTLTELEDDATYYLAATAYDQDENESAYSVELVHSTGNPNYTNTTIEAEDMPFTGNGNNVAVTDGWGLLGEGYLSKTVDFTYSDVRLEIIAKGSYAGEGWPIMEVRIDGVALETVTIDSADWKTFEVFVDVTPGLHEVAFAFINDYWVAPDDRNLYIDKIAITVAGDNLPPEVSIIADDINGIAPLLVILDGSGSYDPDGEIISYDWDFGDGTIDSGDTVSHTFNEPGVYTATLTVTDDHSATGSDTIQITANSTGSHSTKNVPPAADAGASQAVYVNDTVQLDGSSSSDANEDVITFKWSFTSKPSGSSAALSTETAVNPVFVVDVAGSYIVQLIVNDRITDSQPDTVIISTKNVPPAADAGYDQTVEEGDVVELNGFNSTDPNDNSTSYSWKQTGGAEVNLTNPDEAEATFIAPAVGTEPEMLTFQLTVIDAEGIQDIDTCSVQVTQAVSKDSDGVPNGQDDYPNDPDEYLDTDGDGEGTDPNYNESNSAPDPPQLLNPSNDETVGLTPRLETDKFYDPDFNDFHSQTRWNIIRAEDEFIVFDVTSDSSLTSLTVPKMILDYDTDYIWRVKFIDNHGAASDWSEAGYFTIEFFEEDSDGNGILDHQEVDDSLDLDKDGVADREQSDIKCIVADSGKAQIGVSIRDAENIDSILSLEIEELEEASLISKSKGKPSLIEFGLLHFKLLLNAPGQETVVTIHLSRAPFGENKNHKNVKMYKYDPVNTEWLNYTKYAEFSSDRKKVYLTLKDGGFGDADGIENGIIVDPLVFGADSDSNSSSGSGSDSDDSLIPDNISCFIAAAASHPGNMQSLCEWREIGTRELPIVFILMVLGYVGTEIFLRFRQKRGDGPRA